MKLTRLTLAFSLALSTVLSLVACNGQNLPANLPSGVPSNLPGIIKPSGTPASGTPVPTGTPSAAPSTAPSGAPTAPQGKITVVGAELFTKYAINYRVGMKWVYSMKMPGVSMPSLPSIPGFNTSQIPNLSSLLPSSGSSSEMGELTLTVTAVNGDLVTIESAVKMNITAIAPTQPSSVTFSKNSPAALYSAINQDSKTSGTYTYSLIGPESVTVAAGSYNTDKLKGRLEATTQTDSGSVSTTQDALLWMAVGIGMVKQEVTTVTTGVTTKNVIELKSFSS